MRSREGSIRAEEWKDAVAGGGAAGGVTAGRARVAAGEMSGGGARSPAAGARLAQRAILIAAAAATAGSLAAVLLSTARDAGAVPTYAARTGLPCVQCHFDPSGGGPRKELGFVFARQRHDLAPDPSPRWESLSELTNRLGEWFYFGTNTRGYYLYDHRQADGGPEPDDLSTFFTMQSALYATVRPHEHLFLTWALDYNEFSGSQTRDAYGMLEGFPYGLHLRAGRFRNPFGLRWDDHTAGTRYGFLSPPSDVGGVLPFDPRNPEAGVEVGIAPGSWFGTFAVQNAQQAFDGNDVHTVAVKLGGKVQPVQLAVSGYDSYLSSTHERFTRWGAYALYGWRDLSLIGEAVGGENRASGAITRVAGVSAEADYRLSRMILLGARYDLSDRNLDTGGFSSRRFGGDAILTPVPFADLRLSYRRIVADGAGDEDQAIVMGHFYY
jgi:hypothetical protein